MKRIESSTYIRELNKKQIKDLQAKYSEHLKQSRQGFLSMPVKKKLLRVTRFEKDEKSDQSGFFYDIREHAKASFGDFLLLLDTLDDAQIQKIFESQMLSDKQLSNLRKITDPKDMQEFFEKLPNFLSMINQIFKDRTYDDTWQAYMSYYVIIICTRFLKEHGFVSTISHNRLLDEIEDMVNVEIARGTRLKREDRVKGFA